jgi:hypothetical protein
MGLKFETLKRLRTLARYNEWMLSMDFQDDCYCLGVAYEDRNYFTVDYRGTLLRLAGLPMGWSLRTYFLRTLMNVVIKHVRSPLDSAEQFPQRDSKRHLRNIRWRGVRMLPFLNDYLFLMSNYSEAGRVQSLLKRLLNRLGPARHLTKGSLYSDLSIWAWR